MLNINQPILIDNTLPSNENNHEQIIFCFSSLNSSKSVVVNAGLNILLITLFLVSSSV